MALFDTIKRLVRIAAFFFVFLSANFWVPPMAAGRQTQSAEQAVKPISNPKVVISGTIEETKDFFGRKRFIGKVINLEKQRIDFIKIEFTLRDREGKILEVKNSFIKGQRHRFYDRRYESASSLSPNTTGTFDIIMITPADNIFSYTYKITGMHFIYP